MTEISQEIELSLQKPSKVYHCNVTAYRLNLQPTRMTIRTRAGRPPYGRISMKKHFYLLAPLLALTSPMASQSAPLMPQSKYCVTIRGTDGLTPMATLIQNLGDTTSHLVAGDIGLALSIATVRDAIREMNPKTLCASAIVLDKNIYLYHTYLINFTLKFENAADRVMAILFQSASVQAYHGIGKAPWMGLAKVDLENLTKKEFALLEFEESSDQSLRSLMDKNLGYNANTDANTTSLVPLYQSEGYSYYLASEMVPLQSGNPYLTINASRALAIREDANGKLSVAKFNPFFGFYAQMAELVNAATPRNLSYKDHKAKLIEISQ